MQLEQLINELNIIEKASAEHNCYTLMDQWHVKKVGKKFTYIDFGSSGVFLLEHQTGELYNIKAYGQPDYNKKKKANLGNIASVDPKMLRAKRWNYLQ